MADALRITGLGMGLVFAAMALVLVAMILLVRLRDAEPEAESAATGETSGTDEHATKLRVAIIAAAMARVRALDSSTLSLPATSTTLSPWWTHHHTARLASSRRR
jgi:Na+-transporting methylmalonyl-CoA/oxaloacetate decarboxylase gamma subunit